MPDPLIVARHGGFTERLHTTDGREFVLERVADVEPVLEHNKALQRHNPDGMGETREWKHVAEIPAMVWLHWCEVYGTDPLAKGNEDLLRRLLNDPDNRWLRVSEGRV